MLRNNPSGVFSLLCSRNNTVKRSKLGDYLTARWIILVEAGIIPEYNSIIVYT